MEVLVFPKNEEKALQMEKYMKIFFPLLEYLSRNALFYNNRYWMRAKIYLFLKF